MWSGPDAHASLLVHTHVHDGSLIGAFGLHQVHQVSRDTWRQPARVVPHATHIPVTVSRTYRPSARVLVHVHVRESVGETPPPKKKEQEQTACGVQDEHLDGMTSLSSCDTHYAQTIQVTEEPKHTDGGPAGAHASPTADVGHVIGAGNNSGLFVREQKRAKRERKGGVCCCVHPTCGCMCARVMYLLRPLTAEPHAEGAQMCAEVGPELVGLLQHMAAAVKSSSNRCFYCVKRVVMIFVKG